MLNSSYSNFQRGLLGSPLCKGCSSECRVLYDSHHDQYFSVNCGKVVMEMGVFCLDYYINYDKVFDEYDVHFKEQRKKRELEDLKRKK